MDLAKEIDVLYRSRHTLICLITRDEDRVLEAVKTLCEKTKRQFYKWDHGDFFKTVVNHSSSARLNARDPLSALETVAKLNESAMVLLCDFHQCWRGQPRVIRKLRNIAQEFKYTRKTILVTMPIEEIPHELKDDIVMMTVPPPNIQELGKILNHLIESPSAKVELSQQQRENFLRSALGLSLNQAQRVFAQAIVSEGKLDENDLELVIQHKKEIIKESGALEYFTATETPSNVGGLEALKKWLYTRKLAFSPSAEKYGLPAPKGVALIGIPGTGKSLTAKMIAALWGLPLIRLDIGALFGGLVGQSEANVRQAIALCDAVAPCVLWIDEIEKSLSIGGGDGGTSNRVFSNILSWMQEKKSQVFTVATANNIAMLPPELLRRGRFDEIFFLDLPTQNEREEIFKVHISKRNRNPENFDLEKLASESEGYVGAELEQAVIDAMFIAFSDFSSPEREFETKDILAALSKLVPLSQSQKENIQLLRNWLTEGRARSASFHESGEAQKQFVGIELEPFIGD